MKPSVLTLTGLCLWATSANALEFSGNAQLEERYFFHDPLAVNSEQHNNYTSVALEPELYHSWDNDNQSFTFTPYARLDQYDDQRTHADIHELLWQRVFDNFEIKLGISKVFWGVTESQHLVDVINQTDSVEDVDGEDKLGQPMLSISMARDWGVLDVFILPGFRERTFAGVEGRPRTYPVVDTNLAQYQSSDKQQHVDYAFRLLNYLADWEVGLSYFDGTSREPIFLPGTNNGQPVLIPYYSQMRQIGIDAQATTEDWLWKLEIIDRNWAAKDFVALTTGFEYTFVGIHDSDADLGLVMEYLYDSRDQQYLTSFFQNDIMLGLRLTLNDEQSTEALLGVIQDLEASERFLSLEASRRLGNNWKLELEARLFASDQTDSLVYGLRKDDFIQLGLGYYF